MNGLKMKYFVLSPQSGDDAHALACRTAIVAYAHAINVTNPDLAKDLSEWMENLDLTDDREGK